MSASESDVSDVLSKQPNKHRNKETNTVARMSAAMCNAGTGTGSGRTLESLGEDKASVLQPANFTCATAQLRRLQMHQRWLQAPTGIQYLTPFFAQLNTSKQTNKRTRSQSRDRIDRSGLLHAAEAYACVCLFARVCVCLRVCVLV